MYQVEDHPHVEDKSVETIHLYVFREGQHRPSLVPLLLSILALCLLIAVGIFTPYQQPQVKTAIRVPAILLPWKTFTASIAVIPTGVRQYPATTAQGILTISNGSILSEELPKGILFTGNDRIEVVTDTAVFVPAGSADGYGKATVSAHALVSGLQGNIQPFAINQVYGTSLYIRNLTAFTRGNDALSVTFATVQDRQHALNQARGTLLQHTLAGLLQSPCTETRTGNQTISVTWTCQFVTYQAPQGRVLHAEVAGKSVVLEIVYGARPQRFETK